MDGGEEAGVDRSLPHPAPKLREPPIHLLAREGRRRLLAVGQREQTGRSETHRRASCGITDIAGLRTVALKIGRHVSDSEAGCNLSRSRVLRAPRAITTLPGARRPPDAAAGRPEGSAVGHGGSRRSRCPAVEARPRTSARAGGPAAFREPVPGRILIGLHPTHPTDRPPCRRGSRKHDQNRRSGVSPALYVRRHPPRVPDRGRARRRPRLHLGPLLPAVRGLRGRPLRVLHDARRSRGGDIDHPLRAPRRVQLVPQSGSCSRTWPHHRPRLRRPLHPRHRLRLVRARLRRVRLRVRHAPPPGCGTSRPRSPA